MMPGNEVAGSTEASPVSTVSMSVLERFRQLSREKEKPQVEGTKSTAEAVAAVYLNTETISPDKTLSREDNDIPKFTPRDSYRDRGRNRFSRGKRMYEDRRQFSEVKKQKVFHQGLQEKDVGITEYFNGTHSGFHGIIKQRFSDFQVNEIDMDGNLAILTSSDLPPEPPEVEISPEEYNETLTKEVWEKLIDIYESKVEGKPFDIDVTDVNKTERMYIHKCVKKRFGSNMFSNTVEKNGRKFMEISYTRTNKEKGRWPKDRADYLHFIVHKENADTTETINMLSFKLRIKPRLFSYAGTKDKRAVTTQYMSVRRTPAERFISLGELRGVKLGNYMYKNTSLRLGHLKGNRFRIAVRCVDADDEVIEKAILSLKENGFINYFGLQRFGVSQLVPTHFIGRVLLRDDFKQAIELILKPRPGERAYSDIEEAREVWWSTRDARRAVRCVRRCEKSVEGRILQALARIGPRGYVNALESLSRNSVMLYLHAYQSRIWNIIVSRRVKQYGLKPLPGDLIYQCSDDVNNPLPEAVVGEADLDYDTDNEEQTDKADNATVDTTKLLRKLSEDEVDTVPIENVVYPLPGYDTVMPGNEIAEWYSELLREDELTLDMFKKNNKLFSASGSYRKMIAKPWDVQWHTMRYANQHADLMVTDADALLGRPPIESIPDGQYKALMLEISLKPSVYATMALRELMKCETSTCHQASLTMQQSMAAEKAKEQEQTSTSTEKARPTTSISNGELCDKIKSDDVK